MAEEFNQEEQFLEIWKKWPDRKTKDDFRRNEKQAARAIFLERVKTQEDFNKVVLAVVRAIRAGRNGIPEEQLSAIIAVALDTEKLLAQVVERPAETRTLPPTDPKDKDDVFSEVWAGWPENEEHPETEDKARGGWESAVMRHSAENLKIACGHYIESFFDPSKAMKYPKHLSNFVRDDDAVETAILAAALVIPPGDIYEFEAVWRLYPKFPEKDDPEVKKDSLAFWRRHIKSSERPDFLCSVGAYKTKRKDRMATVMPGEFEDAQIYTKSLVSFIGGWKTQPGLARAMGDMLARPLLVLYKANGGGYSWNEWIKNAIMYCGSKWPEERLVGAAKRVLEEMSSGGSGDNITIDILTLAAKAVNDAYVLACKPRESMASSPGATSP